MKTISHDADQREDHQEANLRNANAQPKAPNSTRATCKEKEKRNKEEKGGEERAVEKEEERRGFIHIK